MPERHATDGLAWNGAGVPDAGPGGPVGEVGINARAELAIDPEARVSSAPAPEVRPGTALTVERLGDPPDPARPRPSGRVRLTRT